MSWTRKGLDLLLARFPDAELARVWVSGGVWVCVDFQSGEHFAIWRATGAVYRVEGGAVHDDPFLVPEGSPYDGDVEP